MTVGDKIRYYRELNGLTQKELAEKAKFTTHNAAADVRIYQYENDQKKPKPEAVKKLAEALNVDISALVDINISTSIEFMRVLFEMEDIYNLKTEKDGSDFILRFSNLAEQDRQLQIYLDNWYQEQLKYRKNLVNKRDYDIWKGKFPSVTEVDKQAIKEQIAEMQAQVNELNDKIDFLSKQVNM